MNQLGDFLTKLNNGGYTSLVACKRAIGMFGDLSEADKDRARRIAEAYFAPGASPAPAMGAAPTGRSRATGEPSPRTLFDFVKELESGAYRTLAAARRAAMKFPGSEAERARAERMAEAYFGGGGAGRPDARAPSTARAASRVASPAAGRLTLEGFVERLGTGAYVDFATAKRVIGRCKDWGDADRQAGLGRAAAHFGVEWGVSLAPGARGSVLDEFAQKLGAGAYEKLSGARRAVTMLAGLSAEEKAEARALVEGHFGTRTSPTERTAAEAPRQTKERASAKAGRPRKPPVSDGSAPATESDASTTVIAHMKEVIGTVSEALGAIKESRALLASPEAIEGDVRAGVVVLGRAIRVLDQEIVTRFSGPSESQPPRAAPAPVEDREPPASEPVAQDSPSSLDNGVSHAGLGHAPAAE